MGEPLPFFTSKGSNIAASSGQSHRSRTVATMPITPPDHRARLRAAAHAPLPPCCVTMTAKAAVLGHGLAPVRGRCKHCGNAQIPWYMVLTTPLLPPPTCTNPAGINCNLQPAAIGREMTKIAFWHPEKMRVRHDSKCIFLI